MAKPDFAKLFRNGRSQAVRLPREFRFQGDRVRVRRVADGILLQPMISDPAAWFAELDRMNEEKFLSPDRSQPVTPKRRIFK